MIKFLALLSLFFTVVHGFKTPSRLFEKFRQRQEIRLNANKQWNWEEVTKSFSNMLNPPKAVASSENEVDLTIYDSEIDAAKDVILQAAYERNVKPPVVIENLLLLERLMRKKNSLDKGETSLKQLKNIKGSWRLTFITGAPNKEKKFDKITYFPLKAVQNFDPETLKINNGIYFNDYALIKFFGDFVWKEKARKLEFDFDFIEILGFRFKLPKDENNKPKIKPFFNFIYADNGIISARGASGGIAVWRYDKEMSNK